MMRRKPNAFWRFSLATYGDAAVADACLALQDRCGADVNLLLYCCWIGQGGRALDRRSLRAAMAAVTDLQSGVIRPLRQSRRTLKQPPAGVPVAWAKQLRRRIATIEIDLEYIEQRALVAASKRLAPVKRRYAPRAAIAASLSRYLDLLKVPPKHRDRRFVAKLLDACCPLPQAASAARDS